MNSIAVFLGLTEIHSFWLDALVFVAMFFLAFFINWGLLFFGQLYLKASFGQLSNWLKLRKHYSPWSFLFLFSLFARGTLPYLQNQSHFVDILRQIIFISTMICGGWFFARTIRLVKIVLNYHFDLKIMDTLRLRALTTQMQFLERVFFIVIGLTVFCVTMASFESAREIGGSILASAGIVGIVAGFAAQKSLGNLFAGFQIAFTQPIRLDDIVIVEGQYGKIEEITFTYVVVVTWDLRRLVVPINTFIEKPFENWTRTKSNLLVFALIYLDYSFPVDVLRKEFDRILKETPLWDGKVAGMQMTDNTEHSMVIRALMSAKNAPEGFDLRCYVREKLLAFIQRDYPESLPKVRVESDPAIHTDPSSLAGGIT